MEETLEFATTLSGGIVFAEQSDAKPPSHPLILRSTGKGRSKTMQDQTPFSLAESRAIKLAMPLARCGPAGDLILSTP
ncbi:MAG: hypothetical protein EXS35_02035 [Pedosphaera sp.]|nr:hypothetical protein [Pedosphaera sp.]